MSPTQTERLNIWIQISLQSYQTIVNRIFTAHRKIKWPNIWTYIFGECFWSLFGLVFCEEKGMQAKSVTFVVSAHFWVKAHWLSLLQYWSAWIPTRVKFKFVTMRNVTCLCAGFLESAVCIFGFITMFSSFDQTKCTRPPPFYHIFGMHI